MQKACTFYSGTGFPYINYYSPYKMNIKKNIIKAFMGGIAACFVHGKLAATTQKIIGETQRRIEDE